MVRPIAAARAAWRRPLLVPQRGLCQSVAFWQSRIGGTNTRGLGATEVSTSVSVGWHLTIRSAPAYHGPAAPTPLPLTTRPFSLDPRD
jgi:hypothetical protein